jgi:hypothetical protein
VLVLVVVLVLEKCRYLTLRPAEQNCCGENRALLEARKSTESRTRTSTSTRTIPKFRDLGLARLERSSSGDFGYDWKPGSRFYGKTKESEFMSELDVSTFRKNRLSEPLKHFRENRETFESTIP